MHARASQPPSRYLKCVILYCDFVACSFALVLVPTCTFRGRRGVTDSRIPLSRDLVLPVLSVLLVLPYIPLYSSYYSYSTYSTYYLYYLYYFVLRVLLIVLRETAAF